MILSFFSTVKTETKAYFLAMKDEYMLCKLKCLFIVA